MGFRPEPTIYNLSFQGTFLDGLHVRASCCTVAEYNTMLRAATGMPPINTNVSDDPDELQRLAAELSLRSEAMVSNNEKILELFANHLVSWDLEDMAGQPVPANRAGIDSQERTHISQIIQAWQTALVSVPNLSKTESSTGSISEEQSLGLGNASQSLPS